MHSQRKPLLTQKTGSLKTTDSRNGPHPLICTYTAMQAQTHTSQTINNWTQIQTQFTGLMPQHLQAWVLSQVDQTDWPAKPSVKLTDTRSAEGSCCAALVLSALQYRLPHHTRQQEAATQRAQRKQSKHKLDVGEELPPKPTKDILVTMETPTSSQTDITGVASWSKQGAKDSPYLLSNQLEVRSPQVDMRTWADDGYDDDDDRGDAD